ncbi:MAG TPA: amino acid adenylation domain-containing protein, partial [Thermoanaerobaculia bacterium]|nr:amino acid adenylation domain-containing protein [Thermoanaerobaculia bacterium]
MKQANVETLYRLSPIQEGMLFHTLHDGASAPYFEQFVIPYGRDLDLDLIERVWQALLERHPILRTAFFWEEVEQPVQVVHRRANLPFERLDWRGLSAEERGERLRSFLEEDRARGFALDRAPLLRIAAILWDEESTRIVLSYHHLLLDGWSAGLLLQEATGLYAGFARGEVPAPAPRRPFRDYITWLKRQDRAAAEAYWRRVLDGFEPTALGIDRAPGRPTPQNDPHEEIEHTLSADLTAALGRFARRHRLTLHTVVEAAWALALARFSGSDDVVFGSTLSGRPPGLTGSESMIGCFINTLPVRVRTAPEQSLLAWLRGLQTGQRELERHQHSSLVEVREWGGVPAGRPLFEAILVFENFAGSTQGGDRNFKAFQRTNYPLTLVAWPGRELSFYARYYSGRFAAEAVARLVSYLETLLAALTAAKAEGLRLGDLPPLAPAEQERILGWNRAETGARPQACLHEMFEAQAERDPQAVALVGEKKGGDESLTYRELNERANRLAHHLRSLGVGPEVPVALCLERTPALVVALLATLKAGGAYVPIDPAYPAERQRFLLEDSGAPVLVTERGLAAETPAGVRLLCLDEEAEALAGRSAENPDRTATPGSLAYIIYTSGSTGRPKGVLVDHANVARLFAATRPWFGFDAQDVWTLFHSYAFDFSVWEIWGALLHGGRLVLVPWLASRTPSAFHELLRREGVTVLNQTPSAFRQLVAADEGAEPAAGLRLVIFGGEALELRSLRPWFGRYGEERPRLVNMYGITETTVHVTYRPLAVRDLEAGGSVIGRAIPDLGLRVLDRWLQPVPIGVPGELCVGGAGLARGYLRRPDLTAERFVPDPFGEPGARLYRSGDLVRYRPDGDLEYLGRIDHQVKIRGFRIELGEIEAALQGVDGVRETAVMIREDAPGDLRLVAYLVPAGSAKPAEGALREHLKRTLPDPMVPASFVLLDALPLTANGKVDRKALPAPERSAAAAAGAVAPRNPVEELLAGIWSEVLRVESPGIDDDFFALGGHSLLATQVASRVRRVLGMTPPLRWIFEQPTVRGLAALLAGARGQEAAPEAPPLGPVPRDRDLPLSFAQERLWFLDRLEPDSPFYNLPFALEIRGALSVPVLAASLAAVVERHEALRTTFAMANGRPVQVIAPAAGCSLPVADLSDLPEEARSRESRRLATREAGRPFDLARGPLLRATLLRLGAERHALLFTLHHIVSDGWSMGVLMDEVAALYPALSAGEPAALPELPLQYADFAVWQRQWLTGEALERMLGWWAERLAGAPLVLDLPTDRPRPAAQTYRGAHEPVWLPAELVRPLSDLSRRRGVTLFMTLASLFGSLLSRGSGAEDVLLGSPIAGRQHGETERLIGLFVNTLVLRVGVAGDPAFQELLERTREMSLGAYAHQDLPFEKLVEALQPERSLAHTPVFQAMLVLQNAPVGAVDLPGLTLLPMAVETGTSRFDLLLSLGEAGGGLLGNLEYNRDLFDPATVRRLLVHLQALAGAAAEAPGARISELPLLPLAERQQLLLEWNDTAVARPDGALLHDLFAAQAAKTPQAPAVSFEGRTLTYAELDLATGRLARRLISLGVGADTAVGVLMERSVEIVVALLGVLRAGGGYLPLDPEYPGERLAWIAGDARVPVLLAQERLLPALPVSSARVLCLEEGWDGSGEEEPAGAAAELSDENLAYVLYTSGSTGKPKGVMIPHRGIVNRLLWMQEAYGLTAGDRVLQKTPYSFDVSVWEFFWPLVTGACLVVARPGGHRDSAYLAELIARERVTVMHFVPSMLQVFLEEPDLSGCAGLRLVAASGEALTPELRRRFRERLGARLENLYGPTEASVDVTSWSCAEAARGGIVPIGRPVANTRIHLLDRSFRPAPIGVPGELCIGGVQLARGYWNRPDLTAERFVPDPCGEEPGQRLYRTGDLARHLPDGAVEYLGRIDFQVKVRGFRIELGEIESVLASHPGVREVVVVARESADGSRQIVAYLLPAAETAPGPAELQSFLAARLPEYMVPAFFVALESFPLTPSGKVDRKALPAPEAPAPGSRTAPRTPLEQTLAGIWAELLHSEGFGVGDSFFALGGDSLKAVRLVNRVNERLGTGLRVQDVFKHPSIAALAVRLGEAAPERSIAEDHAAGLAEIERLRQAVLADERQRAALPADWEDLYPLSGIEKGMIYYTLLLPDQPVYHDQHAYLVSIPDLDAFYKALELLMGRHPILRSAFHLYDFTEPMKVVHAGMRPPRHVEDLSDLPSDGQLERIRAYRQEDLHHRFTFDGELLWRLRLFRLQEGLYGSVWTWHHAILDGWSNLAFWIELNELCARPDLDQLESLPPLANTYRDYLAISLGRGRSSATEAFWRETLGGAGRNRLPFHRATTRTKSAFGMRTVERPVRGELLASLRERSAGLDVPFKAVFVAAHIHLLQVTSGERDVVTGVVSHDRPAIPDGDKIVGCFLNTVPIRLRMVPGESGGSLIRRVARFLALQKEHEIPLVDIATLVGARQSAENPIFDTLLNYMDFHQVEDVSENVLFQAAALDGAAAGSPARVEFERNEMTNTLFDLEISATMGRQRLRLKYSPRHFEAEDIERALDLYERILETLSRDAGVPLGTGMLLSQAEREQLLAVYNDTVLDYPRERPLHGFFEEQAARAPERLAVVAGGRSLTYGEIERQANRLAHCLLAQGVQPGDNVGVCFERTPELVVALLGVLKAGAA